MEDITSTVNIINLTNIYLRVWDLYSMYIAKTFSFPPPLQISEGLNVRNDTVTAAEYSTEVSTFSTNIRTVNKYYITFFADNFQEFLTQNFSNKLNYKQVVHLITTILLHELLHYDTDLNDFRLIYNKTGEKKIRAITKHTKKIANLRSDDTYIDEYNTQLTALYMTIPPTGLITKSEHDIHLINVYQVYSLIAGFTDTTPILTFDKIIKDVNANFVLPIDDTIKNRDDAEAAVLAISDSICDSDLPEVIFQYVL